MLKGKFLRGSESPNQVHHLLSDRSKKNPFWRVNHLQSRFTTYRAFLMYVVNLAKMGSLQHSKRSDSKRCTVEVR